MPDFTLAPESAQASQRWRGLRPEVIDGTPIGAPDTPKSRRAYPQPHPGCGFPLIR